MLRHHDVSITTVIRLIYLVRCRGLEPMVVNGTAYDPEKAIAINWFGEIGNHVWRK